MSSRQEEKERRRKEREEAEAAARKSADARKRLGIVGIAVAAIAVITVIGIFALGGGDDKESSAATSDAPTQNVADLEDAAAAAGCTLKKEKNEGSGHTSEPVKYQANPPTSGDHDPNPAEDGLYDPGNPPDVERSVHALEHGRINVQYKPGAPEQRVNQLRGMVDEEVKGTSAYKTLFFENQTGMTPAVAATAWTQSLKCPQWNDKVFDAVRDFRVKYVDKGPEFVP